MVKKNTLPSTMRQLWSMRHILLDLSQLGFFLFLRIKSVLEGQRFSSAEDVIAKATRELAVAPKNGLQECLQKLYERWQKLSLTKETTFKKMLCK
jgi:hypothetical protein